MKKLYPLLVVATLGACALVAAVQLFEPQDDLFAVPFREQGERKIVLSAPGSGERFRTEFYKPGPNGPVKTEAAVTFDDGGSGTIYFRDDQTVREFTRYYPQGDSAGKPQLKERSLLQEDGRKFRSQELYRADGSLLAFGHRLENGHYEMSSFREDGKSLSKRQLFKEPGTWYRIEEFHPNSTLARLSVIEDNYVSYDEVFAPDGIRLSFHWRKFAHEIWETYDESTGILLVRFEKEDKDEPGATYTFIDADYYNADGSSKEHRLFSYFKMVATLTDDESGLEYVQHWRMRNTSAPVEVRLDPENFKLEKVTFERLDGRTDVSVIMDDNGEYVRIVRFSESLEKDGPLDHTRELTFDADGRLIKDVLKLRSKEISATEFGSDGRTGHGIASRYLQPAPYTVPPKVPDDPVYDEGR